MIASSDKGWNSPSAAAVDIGRQEGLERIFWLILPENYNMLQLAKKVGFSMTFDLLETVKRAELKLK